MGRKIGQIRLARCQMDYTLPMETRDGCTAFLSFHPWSPSNTAENLLEKEKANDVADGMEDGMENRTEANEDPILSNA